jgi:lipopolysaccharide biosynthesis glycosyltransferase
MINKTAHPDTIPIVFSSNDRFVPYMSTMIQSIMENAGLNRQYVFYILYREISNNNMDLLRKQIILFSHFSVEFIDVNKYISEYNLYISKHLTVETYFRLLIPYIFSEYQKVIYLDCDMVCCTDIASLFDIDLENKVLAAVWDVYVPRYYDPQFSSRIKKMHTVLCRQKNIETYFNAGMILFNIGLFRESISIKKIFELAQSKEWSFHDQDVLNIVSEGKTLLLPYHWNFFYTDSAIYLPEHLKIEYNNAEDSPYIIHYKPWKSVFNVLYFELFWKYATRTPFIDVIISYMKSDGLIANKHSYSPIIDIITRRKGLGLRFILYCIKAWLFRKKK